MRKTKEEANRTKEEIISAAVESFETIGFEKSSLEEIARRAGVTRGAIYWHFKSKAAVLEEIILAENKKLAQIIESALGQSTTPLPKLKGLLANVIDHFYGDERFRKYIKISWHKLSSDIFDDLLIKKSEFVQNFLTIMEDLLIESKKSGESVSDLDTEQAAYNLSCLINGFYRLYFVAPQKGGNRRATEQLFESFFATIETK